MMNKEELKELDEVMNRIGVLQDISGYKMIELLAHSAETLVDCDSCPLYYKCALDMNNFMKGTYEYNSCEDVWKDYLNLKIDGKDSNI